MANTLQGITSGLFELKPVFEGPMADLINEEVPLLKIAEKVSKGWSGYKMMRPLRTRRNQGIGATSDGGILPKIGRQGGVQAEIFSRFNYLRFGVTGPMIASSQSDKSSFVRAASFELEYGYKDLRNDINRQANWDGTGTLARISTAASGSTTLVVKGRSDGEQALKYIDQELTFDVVVGSTIVASGITVTAITVGNASSAAATITVDIPVTAAVDARLIRSGSLNQEIQGLYYALDGGTTTIYGVDRSTTIPYQGNVVDMSTTMSPTISLASMQRTFNEALRRGAGTKLNTIITDYNGIAAYQSLLTPDKRYSGREGDGSFGNKGQFYLDFNGIPLVPDKDSPPVMTFITSDSLELLELWKMKFADETGTMMIAQSDVDGFEVRVRHFVNMFNANPAADAVYKGYTAAA